MTSSGDPPSTPPSTPQARVRFQERPCLDGQHLVIPLRLLDGTVLRPVVSCLAQFPLEIIALMTLIDHPEYNSTLILRSEVVSDEDSLHNNFKSSEWIPSLFHHNPMHSIHRRLIPRRPGRDGSLEQNCTFYFSTAMHDSLASVLILTPRIIENGSLPYYHPPVAHLAFRYVTIEDRDASSANHLVIEIDPLEKDCTITLTSRVYRTCLSLLEALDRYGWGAVANYQKRVIHDILVPRNEYQDLYIVMKDRHKSLVAQWSEATDPLKHVFEDVGIATFLMLLWKNTYTTSPVASKLSMESERRPWDDWPRPPGGFVDVGCGNGVLTHILLSEGYAGQGFDVRARTSWKHYPPETQQHLHIHAFTPSSPFSHLAASSFIIGNHSDELTPWIPVLATLSSASGYISIPCCPWDFDTRYERGVSAVFHVPQFAPKSDVHVAFVDSLGLGAEGRRKSSYSQYRIWLAYLSTACGWKVECEMLRIPSTRNWAIIGRSQKEGVIGGETAQKILSIVLERGLFHPRKPEGKAGRH